MPRLDTLLATVTSLDRVETNAVWGRAQVTGEERERKIVAYPALVGSLAVGDTVLLNVTATAMALGTGGVDFVIAPSPPAPSSPGTLWVAHSSLEEGETSPLFRPRDEDEPGRGAGGDGLPHLIKLRYAPHQHAVSAAEMSEDWVERESLDGTPVDRVRATLAARAALWGDQSSPARRPDRLRPHRLGGARAGFLEARADAEKRRASRRHADLRAGVRWGFGVCQPAVCPDRCPIPRKRRRDSDRAGAGERRNRDALRVLRDRAGVEPGHRSGARRAGRCVA